MVGTKPTLSPFFLCSFTHARTSDTVSRTEARREDSQFGDGVSIPRDRDIPTEKMVNHATIDDKMSYKRQSRKQNTVDVNSISFALVRQISGAFGKTNSIIGFPPAVRKVINSVSTKIKL